MMTQTERVLQYIRDFGSITTKEAVNDLGCYRLASRIHDIENKMGMQIDRVTEKGKNRYGEPTRFTRYSLRGNDGNQG